jgi:glutathione synthase/RimK-type ligase-like ATP-grasp enzyme
MNNKIIGLLDYKGNFLSKWLDEPYRSGMDKSLLSKCFMENNIEIEFKSIASLNLSRSEIENQIFIYTSSEDIGSHYKSFIEDIVLGIKELGGVVIPDFKFLRAHNNKVLMEILSSVLGFRDDGIIQTKYFSTLEEITDVSEFFQFPVIFKLADGSSGSNVELVKSKNELLEVVQKYCRTKYFTYELRDKARIIKRKGYKKESLFRNKFIVQSFISNLQNDWKVYAFHDKYFIFYRPIFQKRVFKASGGGYHNYFYGSKAKIPEGIFDFAKKIFGKLDVPHASLDIGFNGKSFFLFEFQCLHFGTAGIIYSDECFIEKDNQWIPIPSSKIIEKEYADSVSKYLKQKNLIEC